MKFVIQRVTKAKCEVNHEITGAIEQGFCVLIGVAETDNEQIADKMIKKLLGMRIFSDENGKTNLSITDVNGSLLLISQFTLYANCRKGNRPSFIEAGNPTLANQLYEYIDVYKRQEEGTVTYPSDAKNMCQTVDRMVEMAAKAEMLSLL